MSNEIGFNSDDSPNKSNSQLQLPSPIITRRNRTASTSERALGNPIEAGKIKSFCRSKGHGFVSPDKGGADIFVHISDRKTSTAGQRPPPKISTTTGPFYFYCIEGEYVPLPGDEVVYRLCPIPPKFEKFQAVHVKIMHLTHEKHLKWDELPM